MELCLTHPQHGYYVTRDPLGASGDFTTAPEISQMFGELIGLWMVQQWQKQGSPAPFTLLEIGPGRGTLMADLLRAAGKIMPAFIAAARLHLCEASPVLRAAQAAKLGAYHPAWIDDISSLPAQPLLVVANEFFDALPIAQVRFTGTGWVQRAVTLDAGALAFTEIPTDDIPDDIAATNIDGWLEVSPASRSVMQFLSAHIAQHGGAGLFVDYGYLTLQNVKNCDTLQALQHHQPVNPLADPGHADLTAHVDFSILGWIAQAAKLKVWMGTQGDFLRALGITARAEKLNQPAELARLTAPDQMGDLFKVLIVSAA